MKQQPPCYGCKERHLGCHSNCGSYISFRKDKDEENKQIYSKNLLFCTHERRDKFGRKIRQRKH